MDTPHNFTGREHATRPKKTNDQRVGAVIVFPKGMTKEQAVGALVALKAKGYEVQGPNEFKEEWGGPVWYIP